MNNSVKSAIIFVLGGAVGGLAAYFLLKKPLEEDYKKKKDEFDVSIASMDAYISKLRGQKEAENIAIEAGYTEKPVENEENEDEIVVKSANFYPKKTDYAAIYKQKIASEHPQDDDPEEENRINSSRKINEIANSGARPEAITEEMFNLGHSDFEDSITLNYYIRDDILANEDDEIIPKRSALVGNLIEETGFNDNDEDALYVRNYSQRRDYEIDKIYEPYDQDSKTFYRK